MYGNKLSGTIPSELGRLTRLKWLRLEDNNLTGSMPTEVCSLRRSNGNLDKLEADCKNEVRCKSGCCTACY